MIVTVYVALGYFVRFIELLIFARCILSWLPINFNSPIVHFIYILTEPFLGPIRKLLYKSPLGGPGMILDISPIILLFIVNGLYSVIGSLLGMF
jgi:YggT family protein